MKELSLKFKAKKVEGWYQLWERVAQFIACAYSKKKHHKIKNDARNNKYLESLQDKKHICSKDLKAHTPFGQIIYEYYKQKEDELSTNSSPLELLRQKMKEDATLNMDKEFIKLRTKNKSNKKYF